MSMATGEYVSVCSQRDVEEAELAREAAELKENPRAQLKGLKQALQQRGIDQCLADEVAHQLTEQDALAAHAQLELGIDPEATANPWHAAFASLIAFTVGGLIPLLAVLLAGGPAVIWACGIAVLVALSLTGLISAKLSGAPAGRAIVRNVLGGLIGMAVTFGVGRIAGTKV
jgi:VIT1/CCC1 family predicted Fe2+/Mn2+ transporter